MSSTPRAVLTQRTIPTRWESEYLVVPDAGDSLLPLRIALAAIRAIMPNGIWPMLRHLATNVGSDEPNALRMGDKVKRHTQRDQSAGGSAVGH